MKILQLLERVMEAAEKRTKRISTILRKSQIIDYLISALLVMYMAGSIIFHLVPNENYDPIWDSIYYLWDLVKDLLFWIILLSLVEELSIVFFLVLTYSFIRLCMEVITTIIGTGPNVWFAVDTLFLVLLLIILFLTIKQKLKKWRKNS